MARLILSHKSLALAAQSPTATAVVRDYLDALIAAGLIALLLITFVLRTFYIPSGSMRPTLQRRDVLLVNEFAYRFHPPRRGDIVVFQPPIASSSAFIKRIVAVPGDTLRVWNGAVYVNGKRLYEPYVREAPDYNLIIKNYGIYVDDGAGLAPLSPKQADVPPRKYWQSPNRVPKGFYFVMGDNRNDSDDSHVWGFAQYRGRFVAGPLVKTASRADFTGRAFLVLWPFDRLRILE